MNRSRRAQILIVAAAFLSTLALPSASGTERSAGSLVADPEYGGDGIAEMGRTCGEPPELETTDGAGQVYMLVRCGRHLQVAALDATGEPLRGFGTDGVARVPKPWRYAGPMGLVVDRNGRVTIGMVKAARGDTNIGKSPTAIVRLASDGTADLTFGRDGISVIRRKRVSYDYERFNAMIAIDPRGRTLVLRKAWFGQRFEVVRLRPNGSLDRRFGRDGRVVPAVNDRRVTGADARVLLLDGATPYVVTDAQIPWKPGWVRDAVVTVRLTRHGRIDQRYAKRNGRAVLPLPTRGTGAMIEAAVDPVGRVVLAVHDQNNTETRSWTLVRRLTSTGRVDRRFARHAGTIRARGATFLDSLGLVGRRPVIVQSRRARRHREIAQVHGFTAAGRPWSALGADGVASVTSPAEDYTYWPSMSAAGLYEVSSCYCATPIRVHRFLAGSG